VRLRPPLPLAGRLAALALAAAVLPGCRAGGPGSPAGPPGPGEPATLLTTPAEKSGEAVYRRENCGRCHTLFAGALTAGEFALPRPADPEGTSRVGPDLGFEGHRRSDDWQYAHLYDPRALSHDSRMPGSRHLFAPGPDGRPAPGPEAVDLVAYMQALGRAGRDIWARFREREPAIAAPPPADAALRARGDDLYARHCASCHGPEGDGRGIAAGLLRFPPRSFAAGRYRFKSTPAGDPPTTADRCRSVTRGGGTGSAMPAFYWLDPRDGWALVLRLKQFSPALRGDGLDAAPRPPGRPPEGGPGVYAEPAGEGRALWRDLGCARCHGERGAGLSREEAGAAWADAEGVPVPRSGDLTHACALRGGASAEALERAVLLGVGSAMPAYADALPGARPRRALTAFLLSLREAEPAATSPRTRSRP